jgi:hypothetical protein
VDASAAEERQGGAREGLKRAVELCGRGKVEVTSNLDNR